MSIDPKFVELTADILEIFSLNVSRLDPHAHGGTFLACMWQQYPRVVGPVDQSVADLVFPANEVMSIVLLPLFCCTWAGPNSSPQYYVDYFSVKCTTAVDAP